jgi:hypothetical protein
MTNQYYNYRGNVITYHHGDDISYTMPDQTIQWTLLPIHPNIHQSIYLPSFYFYLSHLAGDNKYERSPRPAGF